jgi:hypothetical protein
MYVNFYCEKISDRPITVTFCYFVMAELNRMFTIDTGMCLVNRPHFPVLCHLVNKSGSTFLIIKVKIYIIIELISCI